MVDHELLKAFGRRVRELRTARGLSQEQLAELTGFHRIYTGRHSALDRRTTIIYPQRTK